MLPFVTQPTPRTELLGNSEIGELQIERLNELSVNERLFIKEHSTGTINPQKEAVKLARACNPQEPGDLLKYFTAIIYNDLIALGDHLDKAGDFRELATEATNQKALIRATAVIRFRLAPEWTIDDSKDHKKIHPLLLQAIADFAYKEEHGWEQPEVTITEDDLKKSKPSRNRRNRTGSDVSG